MGLLVSIFRDGYDSDANVFFGKKSIVLVDLPGPSEPTDDAPAARIGRDGLGGPCIIPDYELHPANAAGPMFGGTLAATSDSRFPYRALRIHDRFESWPTYYRLST